jgi:hypothetical protein
MFIALLLLPDFNHPSPSPSDSPPQVILRRRIDVAATRRFRTTATTISWGSNKEKPTEDLKGFVSSGTSTFVETLQPVAHGLARQSYRVETSDPVRGYYGGIPAKQDASIQGTINDRNEVFPSGSDDLSGGPNPMILPNEPLILNRIATVKGFAGPEPAPATFRGAKGQTFVAVSIGFATGIPFGQPFNFQVASTDWQYLGQASRNGALCNHLNVVIHLTNPWDITANTLGPNCDSGSGVVDCDLYLDAKDGDLQYEKVGIRSSQFCTPGVTPDHRNDHSIAWWFKTREESNVEVWRT